MQAAVFQRSFVDAGVSTVIDPYRADVLAPWLPAGVGTAAGTTSR